MAPDNPDDRGQLPPELGTVFNPILGPPELNDRQNRTDIDCLLVVMRYLLMHIPPIKTQRSATVSTDPSFDIAAYHELFSQLYELDTTGEKREALRSTLLQSGFHHKAPYGDNVPAFVLLAESKAMQSMFWSSPSTSFWEPDLQVRDKNPADSPWTTLPKDSSIFSHQYALSYSLAVYNPSVMPSDQRRLDTSIAVRHGIWDLGEYEMKLIANQPVSIRVRFLPGGERGFKDVCRLVHHSGEPPGQRHTYYLVAAVRLRAALDERDLVRLFNEQHQPLILGESGTKCQTASYIGHEWRVGEPGHQYMLYFAQGEVDFTTDPGEGLGFDRPNDEDEYWIRNKIKAYMAATLAAFHSEPVIEDDD